jgi:hypothetical protein
MKTLKLLFAGIAVLLCFESMPVQAEIIQIGFTAHVDNVNDQYNLLGSVGDIITGYYVYNSATPDTIPSTYAGEYWHYTEPYGMSLTMGGITFQTDPTNVKFVLGVTNDSQGQDAYYMNSYNNLAIGVSVLLDPVSWSLSDNFGVAISSTYLPIIPPDLSKWPFNNLIISGGKGGSAPLYDQPFSINGHVTEVYLVPEPISLCLLGLGGLILRRKF